LKKFVNYHITVSGRVQGVGYRAFTVKTARSLGISGFAKNNVDGTVFIEAEGEEITISKFLKLCELGPGWANVERVSCTEYPVMGHQGFHIKY